MKSMIVVLTVAILALAPGIATADDEEDVIAAVLDYISGWNNGDAAKIAQYMLPDATSFTQGTGLAAAPFNQTALQNNMNNGADFNLFFRNMKVQVYGDTAVFRLFTDLSTGIEGSGSAPSHARIGLDEPWPTSVSARAVVHPACRVRGAGQL